MAGLSLSTQAKIFPCPTCGRTINTSMAHCPDCASPVDATAAEASAAAFGNLNQSISDASYLRIMFGVGMLCFLGRFLLGFANLGFLFILVALPFMTIRWWVKYGKIRSTDPEFSSARRTVMLFGIGGSALCVVLEIGIVILSLVVASANGNLGR